MYIFIDEAGKFIDPNNREKGIISTVGAIVIPHDSYDIVIEKFQELKEKWGIKGETKGGKLKEHQVDELVQMLELYNILFVAVCVDSQLSKPDAISWHKQKCQEHILSNISEHHHPNLVQQLKDVSRKISELSDQLYIQYQIMNTLVYNTHELSTLYYVQRLPAELSAFKWVIDAKDKKIVPAEKWWRDTLSPNIQGLSFKKAFVMLQEADYSYYNKFDMDDNPLAGNIKKIMRDLEFIDSKTSEGLQIADILTSSINKALNNKFEILGWYRIGRLMTILDEKNVLTVLSFDEKSQYVTNVHIALVIKKLRKTFKPLFLKD